MSSGRLAAVTAMGLACAATGAMVGLATVVLHDYWPAVVLSVAACTAVLVALPRAWCSRPPFVVAFATVVVLAMMPRAEGDYLIAADAAGYTLLGLTLVMVVATLFTVPTPRGPSP